MQDSTGGCQGVMWRRGLLKGCSADPLLIRSNPALELFCRGKSHYMENAVGEWVTCVTSLPTIVVAATVRP